VVDHRAGQTVRRGNGRSGAVQGSRPRCNLRTIDQGETRMELKGIHHLTAVSARISENYRFYTGVMGMRLVKRSVNQDDVSAYHLFYADAIGTPGTDLTFFDWKVPREERGTRSITRTGLRVNGVAS